jgi:hypothetical protein
MSLYKEVEVRIDFLLKDLYAKLNWTHSPQVGHIPTDKSRESFYLLINICVKPEWVDREKQINDCLTIARVVIGSGLLTDERAVEVSAFAIEDKNSRRVFCLSVYDTAFAQVMEIEAADLLNKQFEGITCQWRLKQGNQ